MKEMKKFKGLAALACCTFAFTMSASADVVKETVEGATGQRCTVSTSADFKAASGDTDCRAIIVAPGKKITLEENITVDNKVIYLKDEASIDVTGNEVVLTLQNYVINKTEDRLLTNCPQNTTQFIFGNQASLNVTNGAGVEAKNMEGIVFQEASGAVAEINIDGEESGILIHNSTNGIARFTQINVSNGAGLGFQDNSGYGSNTAAITLNDGVLLAERNLVGLTSKLVTTGESIVAVTENQLIGLNLKENSNIGGDTQVAATGNNTNNDTERGGDITIFATETEPVVISENAVVVADNVRSYYDKWAVGGPAEVKGALEINGEAARLFVESNQKNADGSDNITLKEGYFSDVTKKETIIAGTPALEITVEDGETLVITENTDLTNTTIIAKNGATIQNNTATEITVTTDNGDVVVETGKDVVIQKPATPEEPATPITPENKEENPNTGDMNIAAVLSLALVSVVGCLLVGKKKLARNR